jgi:hypothetical protein
MKLECYREGLMGFHVGDVVHLPDDVDRFDSLHFKIVSSDDEEAKKAAELAEHERLVALKQKLEDAESASTDPVAEAEKAEG